MFQFSLTRHTLKPSTPHTPCWTQPEYTDEGEIAWLRVTTWHIFCSFNLLRPEVDGFDAARNEEVIGICDALIDDFLATNGGAFFSEPIESLHERLTTLGDPSNAGDGQFVRPFLNDSEYRLLIEASLEAEAENVPPKLKELYLTTWSVPEPLVLRSADTALWSAGSKLAIYALSSRVVVMYLATMFLFIGYFAFSRNVKDRNTVHIDLKTTLYGTV